MINDDEMMRKAVRAFYDGAGFEALEKASGKPLKYNQAYFDSTEAEIRKGLRSKEEVGEKADADD